MTWDRWRILRGVALGLSVWLAAPGVASALRMFPAAEVQEAQSLHQRILAEVPSLDPRQLREHPRLPPETIASLQERLAVLQTREAGNPFFHWAQGELVRQAQGSAAAAPAFERARQTAGPRPLIHWILWQDFLARGLLEEAQREERALQAIQLTWGLSRFPLLAVEEIRQASEAADGAEFSRAFALYDAALANVPESAEALIGRAGLSWQRDKTQVLQVLRDLASGLFQTVRGAQTGFRLTSNLFLSLLIAWLAALCLVAAIVAVKIQPLISHELREGLFKALPAPTQVSLGFLVLLLPFMLGLGLFWAAVGVLLVCAPYLTRPERWLASVLLAALLGLPAGYEWVAARHVLASSPQIVLARAAEEGGRGETLVQELRRWAEEAPNNALPHYYLGLVLKRRGELAQAEEAMAHAARLLPREGFALVGLGNLQYLQGRLEEAEATYRRAAVLLPSSAAVQMNLSKLYTQRLQLDPSNDALTKSLKLDPHMVHTASSFHGQGVIQFVVDESVPWRVLTAGLVPRDGEVRPVAEGLWGSPLRGVSLRLLPYVGGGLLLLFWGHVRLRGRTPPVRRCRQCRATFCAKCQPIPKEKEYCSACAAAFRQREGVAAFVKVRRIREGEEWLRREALRIGVVGSLVPGGGDLYEGRVVRGLLLCLSAVWLLLEGLVLDILTPSFRFALPLQGPLRSAVVLLLLLSLSAYSWQRSWSRAAGEGP